MSSDAVAPVMISTNSPVITACRVLLYKMEYLLIMSPAFLEAFYDVQIRINLKIRRSRATYIHSIPSSGLFASMSLSKSPVERVSQRIFSQVDQDLIVNFECCEIGRLGESLLGKCLDSDGFVALGIDKFVVQNLDARVFFRQHDDLVCNSLGIGEGGDIFSDTSKAEGNILVVGTTKLGLGLLADDGNVEIRILLEHSASGTREAGMDTTAKSLVGAGNHDEGLLLFQWLCLRLFKHLVRCLAVFSRVAHGFLGASELCGGYDFHGFGDLFNVADGFETAWSWLVISKALAAENFVLSISRRVA